MGLCCSLSEAGSAESAELQREAPESSKNYCQGGIGKAFCQVKQRRTCLPEAECDSAHSDLHSRGLLLCSMG